MPDMRQPCPGCQGASEVKLDGLKLVRLNTARIDEPDDPADATYPYRLEVNLRPPELMEVAFIMMHGGSEVIVVRGKTRSVIDEFVDLNDLKAHPRLRRMSITGPGGLREEISR